VADDREYRETFRYRTEDTRADQARANIESAAERFNVALTEFNVITGESSRVTVEVTVVGTSANLNRMRENVVGSVSVFEDSRGGAGISDLVWDMTAGPVLDVAATRLRRGWWSVQRRRPGDDDTTRGSAADSSA
jgi:hypothetical protein